MSESTAIMIGILLAIFIVSICISGEKNPEEDDAQIDFINEWRKNHKTDV